MNLIKNVSRTKTIHPCQIPESLSGLLMRSCTIPGDTIFILFGGSGSEVIQAKSMGLTYMTCELQSRYVEMIKSRLSEGRIGQKYAWQGRYKWTGRLLPDSDIPSHNWYAAKCASMVMGRVIGNLRIITGSWIYQLHTPCESSSWFVWVHVFWSFTKI